MIKLFSSLLLVTLALASSARAEVRLPSEEEAQKMTAAMPSKARVKPAKPRRILVIGQNDAHAPVSYAAKALQIMGQKTGAFKAIISNDGSLLESEKLLEFD